MSDDTRDLIAELRTLFYEANSAEMRAGSVNADAPGRAIQREQEANALCDLLRAALEQRKPTLPDSELLATLRKHDAAMTAGEWRISEALGEGFAHVVYSGDAGVCRCDNNPRHKSLKSPVDAEGIAAIRNLLPRIITALEQADRDRTELERLRGMEAAGKALVDSAWHKSPENICGDCFKWKGLEAKRHRADCFAKGPCALHTNPIMHVPGAEFAAFRATLGGDAR